MKNWIIILPLAMVAFEACGFRGSDEASLYSGDAALASASPTFASLKSYVLTPNCVGCHPGFATEAGLSFYVSAGNPSDSTLYTRTNSGSMPPSGKMSAAKIDLIRRYIVAASGQATNQRVEPLPEPTTPPLDPTQLPTYAQIRERILQPMCSECHGEAGFMPPKFFDEATTIQFAPRILARVEAGTMPPRRFPVKPTADDIAALRAWVSSLSRVE